MNENKPYLIETPQGLTLTDGNLEMRGDFSSMLPRLKKENLGGEMLVRAASFRNLSFPLTVIDATAGMGEDSFLLAAAGFDVILYEYNPIIAALLRDALARAMNDPLLSAAAGRMKFIEGDSVSAMRSLDFIPDVVYLDPMFPARQKSGMIKKKFQLLQKLEYPCSLTDGSEFLDAALSTGAKKIVIKRPAKGEYLGGKKPSYSIGGTSVRYDCVVR